MSDVERTYPRKWYRVSRFGGEIGEREFIRETDRMLFRPGWGNTTRREAKADNYGRWFPEREEAETVLAAINERKDEKKRADRIRDAAPELLEALERLAALSPGVANASTAIDLHLTVRAIAETAIAKARGQ